ncbi:MAG: nuclear transport factor 2 family protein [Deltaproteobacteria bacterium]|nr:nuclear transport factor 2 family protein [Deltaproteobacteria bacterium]
MKNKKTPHTGKTSNPITLKFSPIFNLVTIVAALLGCLIGLGLSSLLHSSQHEPSLRKLILQYFAAWSHKDMETYGACFDPSASIYLMKNGQVVLRQHLRDFLENQINLHKMASSSLEEHAEDIDMFITDDLAYIRVLWKLTAGDRVSKGYDHFILSKTPKGWKIVTLLFYEI